MDEPGSGAGPAAGIPAYIVVDTQDPGKITPFWCALLGVGVFQDRDNGKYVTLEPSPKLPGSMMLTFQHVPEPKAAKNRVHVDVFVFDLDEATAQVEALGGQWAEPKVTLQDGSWISRIAVDPEGNEFCICLAPSRMKAWRASTDETVVHNPGKY